MNATSTATWFSDDDHAGSMVGLLLGISFLIAGLVIMLVKEHHMAVPLWRKLTGISLIGLGLFAIIVSIVFAAQ